MRWWMERLRLAGAQRSGTWGAGANPGMTRMPLAELVQSQEKNIRCAPHVPERPQIWVLDLIRWKKDLFFRYACVAPPNHHLTPYPTN